MITVCRSGTSIKGAEFILLLLFGIWGLLLSAASDARSPLAPDLRFDNPFDRADTTSHQMGAINSIIQDEFGFIWLAAENGLGRYDGRTLKLYQSDPQSQHSLPANFIWRLAVDRDGVLWQAGEGGLSRYNAGTDNFTHVTAVGGTEFTSSAISALAVAADNTLYVGGAGGLHAISPDRASMTVHLLKPPIAHGPNVEQIRSLAIDKAGKVWIGTAGMGVAIFDPDTEAFEYLVHDPENPQSLAYDNVRSIVHDRQGRVWLGTYGRGISRFNPATGEFVHFAHSVQDKNSLGSDIVLDITEDSQGVIWVALDQGGLARFDETSQSFHHYHHTPYDPQSLISNQLRVVFEDRSHDLWIGAFPSGVSFYNRSTQIFRHYTTRPNDPESISHNAVVQFLETDDGTIWVGTEGGLNALDPQTGKFRRYLSDPMDPQALKANPVLAIEEGLDGYLWIGTWAGGLHRFDPDTGLFERFPANEGPGSINSVFIWDLLFDSKNRLWIGTEDGGLNRYHRDSNHFSHFVHDPNRSDSISGNFVPAILEDSRGQLWIGTFTGLDRFNPQTNSFFHVPHDTGAANATRGKNIRSLYEDSRGLIWVGTEHRGVNIYNPLTGTFSWLGVADGLPSSNISSIIEDNSGDMWLATTNGLARVDRETFTISNFQHQDGVAGDNFNRNASLKDRHGNLYFGSTEGITVFHPRDLKKAVIDFPVLITQFRLFNREVPIGGDNSPLETSILLADHLFLSHADTMFSFELVALNYRRSEAMHYSYRLEGFDRDWNDIGQNTIATYTNISPGNYVFHTRASVDGENWINGQSLAITISPPPWRTWWAYLLYLLFAGALLVFAQKYITLRVRAETYRSKSITDPLTNLYNRAGTAQIAEGIFANPETRKGLCLMLLDVDHFKRINDQRGHDAGDRILCGIAKALREGLRTSDHIGRWGGEEFVLLCATQKGDNSRLLAEKVRTTIEDQVHEGQDTSPLCVTVSIGVTDLRPDDTFERALKRADTALYTAKAKGRNCVVLE